MTERGSGADLDASAVSGLWYTAFCRWEKSDENTMLNARKTRMQSGIIVIQQ
jgi:hypothetical protein